MGEAAPKKLVIGVLALQGAFIEHINLLKRLTDDVEDAIPIRTKEQLADPRLDALILPGGESTTIALIAERNGLLEPLKEWVHVARKPVWGTCAGLILLANTVSQAKQGGQSTIGGLDVTVRRNAFGAQIDSFTAPLSVQRLDSPETPYPAVFIRAPIIESLVAEKGVEVLASVQRGDQEPMIVAVKQGRLMGSSFHPELTNDDRFHRLFLRLVREALA
ncbi:PdxT/SNO family [Cladochytrium replicatum]|nr:PdxT/SNO family [Cladochytrium replicatum]